MAEPKTRERSGQWTRDERGVRRCSTEYRIWQNIKTRCFNRRNAAFPDYGGRGITMCQEWASSFTAFLAHVGPRPAGCSIDRIDNDGDYTPGNVKWSTAKEQASNRRNRSLDARGKKLTRAQVLEIKLSALSGTRTSLIAAAYGISDNHVRLIRNNKVWKDIEHARP